MPRESRKHTGKRRDGGNASDEQSPSAKRQKKSQTLPKKSGVAHDGGQQFEIKMAAVIGLRGMARGDDFQLSTNKAGCGNFDDLVYTAGKTRYFLQLKHTDNPDTTKLVHSDLVPLLHQCFESYYSIIQDPTFKDFESSEFIIYTNKQLGQTMKQHDMQPTVIDEIFKTCDTGEIFNFTPDENKEIDVYTLVENKVKESKEFGELIPERQNFKRKMISEFLGKLIMVTGQKKEKEIDNVIIDEIRKLDARAVDPKEYQMELLHFKTSLESWWRNKNETMKTETLRNWLQEAKTEVCTSVVGSLFENCKQKSFGTEIKFSDSEISRLHTELSNKRAVHLRSDALTLCSILLLDCLDTTKCIFVTFESLQSNKNTLLHAWLGGYWEWLIVFCDSTVRQRDTSDTCLEVSKIIKTDHSTKHVIILTACSLQPINDFVPIEHIFNFQQLSKKSQDIVLDKKVDFQGCEVTMRSVLERHGNVQHVLGPELVTDLMTEGTAVNIGGRLQNNEEYYALRELERYIWLHSNVLQNSNDVFVVSGPKMEDLFEILPSHMDMKEVWIERLNPRSFTQDMSTRIFLLSEEDVKNSFREIGEKLNEKTLHWVELRNGDLLWKMSRGGTDTLLDYIDAGKTRADKRIIAEWMKRGSCEVDEESIWDLGERTVLVVTEPGMGKSSTTTQVAWNTKLADPTWWVVRINWNDHTRKLQEINEATFNFDSLVEFLCSAAFTESKYTDFDRRLLKHALQNGGNVTALQNSGNVTVLMDGFDEISPTHENKANVILSELMKTKVKRVWVTSRPVQKERLEEELSVFSVGMKRLSRASQKEMLRNLLKYKADEKEYELNNFLRRVNRSVHDANFTGCPLYIMMIATVYEMETNLKSGNGKRPEIDLVNMYEVFLERKLHIYLFEKRKADKTNAYFLDDEERLKEPFLKDFEICALVVILPPSILKSLHNKEIEEDIKPFLASIQAGNDKRGVVMNVVDGKPHFVHRTFAEFLTARWFSRNFKFNRSVLEDILFDPTYRFMTGMFDRMLARGLPLHCAVTDTDFGRYFTLLEEGRDLNALDKGGRSFTHLIAKNTLMSSSITRNDSECEVYFDITDSVLQWTPLQYAIKSKQWFAVEQLLKSNVGRSGLDMIRQRAQDPDYINPIIVQAAQHGQLLLLGFIRSIDVNIHQASDRGYPSPLHAAIRGKQPPVIRWLIQHDANCNTRYSDGQTPLFDAVTTGLLDVVQPLVEEGGASLDIRDVHGNTVIDWAKKCKLNRINPRSITDIVQYLEKRVCKNHECTSEK